MVDVLKFGGTSVADKNAFNRCVKIIANSSPESVVVLSASAGVTQSLVDLSTGIKDGKKRDQYLSGIRDIQNNILDGLKAPEKVSAIIEVLLNEIEDLAHKAVKSPSLQLKDKLLALGEQMSSHLLVQYLLENNLKAQYLDARSILKTDNSFGQAEPQINEIAKLAKEKFPIFPVETVLVTQGFIGSTSKGETTTLGRGGSDYSAALMAEAFGARELQIWTDVCGIFSTDPRIEKNAIPIPEISFNEAAEMATFGAKVLHPKTLWPAIRANIPVMVGSSREPEEPGTRILPSSRKKTTLTAVALRKDQTLLTLTSFNMLQSYGFLAKVFGILDDHKVSVDLVTTSEVSVALTFDQIDNSKGLSEALLKELGELGEIKLDQDLALIAIIGSGMNREAGIASWIFTELSEFNLRLICHGASQHNICFLVDQNSASEVVKRIHTKILEKSN